MIKIDELDDTTPIPLAMAARLFFPDGSISKKSLRLEAARGRLTILKIAGKYFTTRRAIMDMQKLCEVDPALPPPSSRGPAVPGGEPYAREIFRRLKKGEAMPGQKKAEIQPFPGKK